MISGQNQEDADVVVAAVSNLESKPDLMSIEPEK